MCVTSESETSAGIVRCFSRENERVFEWEYEIYLFFVCMNAYISETMRAWLIKFGDYIYNHCT